jgi:hypothetical protein
LEHQQLVSSQPVSLLESSLTVPAREQSRTGSAISDLKVTLTEQCGVLYLKLRGLADSLHRKELQRILKGFLPRNYSQMVINTEGLRFASQQAATAFGAYFEKLGCRMHRLQIITTAGSEGQNMLNWNRGDRLKMPCFELLLKKR